MLAEHYFTGNIFGLGIQISVEKGWDYKVMFQVLLEDRNLIKRP